MDNHLNFLISVCQKLDKGRVHPCIFGGWAEELRELIKPRVHNDIDLLYCANDFLALDKLMSEQPDFIEIPKKHFEHKRAFELNDIMVEITLVRPNLTTTFFGKYDFTWPSDTFAEDISVNNLSLNVSSQAALKHYRENYNRLSYGRATAELIV